ncbi:hypothetical protein BDW72DRAFT_174184 [Aspergillus terricola var. indicus]
MDETRTDEDTNDEVNVLIFDYIICLAIHAAIGVAQGNTDEWDIAWLEDALRALRSVLPPMKELPVTLQIKAQVFEIVQVLSETSHPGPAALSEMASTFVSTCNAAKEDTLATRGLEVASQLCNESGQTAVIDNLVYVMQLLAPPILIQLERGRLEGLNRNETQQLKRRIGLA